MGETLSKLSFFFQKEVTMPRNLSLGVWPGVTTLSPDLIKIAQQYESICFEASFYSIETVTFSFSIAFLQVVSLYTS